MKRRRKARPQSRPWSPEEGAQLAEVNAIGLRVEYWPLALPDRKLGEMLNRRLELGLKPAALI